MSGALTRRGLLGAGLLWTAAACGGADDPATDDAASLGRPLQMRCRSDWGAAPMRGDGVRHTIDRLTVHHTAVPMQRPGEAPGQLRAIQRHHQAQGWPDIAYHYLVGVDGTVYEGRDPAYAGDTFTSYDPRGHLLVCLLGDFDRQRLQAPALEALAGVLAGASVRYGVAPSTIAGHAAYEPDTSCPGRQVAVVISDGSLAERVTDLAAQDPHLDLHC